MRTGPFEHLALDPSGGAFAYVPAREGPDVRSCIHVDAALWGARGRTADGSMQCGARVMGVGIRGTRRPARLRELCRRVSMEAPPAPMQHFPPVGVTNPIVVP
jgi:hypothetical protein